ncbi:putative quinol monooxygenase [Actinoplanes xinjiangensis]|uniref:Antibiotic biosynthesis monooxygenase n=1 Tax=Actinoplanes xinjiangensis TaxID=512350 RepID=A0A316FPB0_9ACTN|nr:antibiotic biosynthesis monooxygenase family protein [Actinoplanes xinjiangensis]PWK40142.1 antibiotic biosynthesis monooxygenase [Actinoplanes xinjiangensis]GIF42457.1 antibiotic biosynthesis monooxygenase [Actinoplanes xinjiangensis]
MIIIAGELRVEPSERDRYLAGVADVTRRARSAEGCLDFVQAPDPLDPARITVYERWESDEDLHRFRDTPGPSPELPAIRSADVHKYRISAVEQP